MRPGSPARDSERLERIDRALRRARLDALVCTLPSNVLLLSGYWPVVGTSVAVATREGAVGLAPEDEVDLAGSSWAEIQETFAPGSLRRLPLLTEVVTDPLSRLLDRLGVARGRIGYECGPLLEPSSYAGTNRYVAAVPALLSTIRPAAELTEADDLFGELRAVLTRREVQRLRLACRVAGEAFRTGAVCIVPEASEREVAAAFRAPLEAYADRDGDALTRAGGFTWCMSGPDAALAGRAYARSRTRRIRRGDLVMVHCNSYVDGFWTDITRTYHPSGVDERVYEVYDAVLSARATAMHTVAPGVPAREVDRAARDVLAERGFGDAFPHGTGHGVGFTAIDHLARPRIHPASDDVLEQGMVFKLEPAVYLEGWGGVRHCDMVAVTAEGVELLTPFQSTLEVLAPRLWEPG